MKFAIRFVMYPRRALQCNELDVASAINIACTEYRDVKPYRPSVHHRDIRASNTPTTNGVGSSRERRADGQLIGRGLN